MEANEINYPPGVYEFTLTIGYAGATRSEMVCVPSYCGYTEKDWLELEEVGRERAMSHAWQQWTQNYIEGGFERVES